MKLIIITLLLWSNVVNVRSVDLIVTIVAKSHTAVFSKTHVRLDVYSTDGNVIIVEVELPQTITIQFGVIDNRSGEPNPPCDLSYHSAVCTVYTQPRKVAGVYLTLIPLCAIPIEQTLSIQAHDQQTGLIDSSSHTLTVSRKYQWLLAMIGA